MDAVIFDFDGTLVDTEPLHERAIRAALRGIGIDLSREAFYSRFVGLPDDRVYAQAVMAAGRSLLPEELAGLRTAKNAIFEELVNTDQPALYEGVEPLLRTVAMRCPIAVASAAQRHEILGVLGRAGVSGLFRTVVGVEDVMRSKPDPAPYLLACERLGVQAGRCIAVEDTPTGVASARGAGLRVVAVGHTFMRERLGEAHYFVPHIRELNTQVFETLCG